MACLLVPLARGWSPLIPAVMRDDCGMNQKAPPDYSLKTTVRRYWWVGLIALVVITVAARVAPAKNTTSGGGGGSSNRVTLTSCTFKDGWVEASGSVVRGAGTADGIVINLLVNGKFVDRDYLYDPPVGETMYWKVSEPDVAQGTCTVDLD